MKTTGLFQPLVLAGVLAGGFAVAWAVLGLWAVQVGEHLGGPRRPVEGLLFLPDGTARVNCYAGPYEGPHYRDLEGNPTPPPENEAVGTFIGARLPAALSDRPGDNIRSFSDGGWPAVYWYFICDSRPDGAGYFVGYDSKSKVCVGCLGTAGFRTGPLPAGEQILFTGTTWGDDARVYCMQQDRGPTDHPRQRPTGRAPHGSLSPWDVYVLGTGGKIYHADLRARTLNLILDEPRLRSAELLAGLPDNVRGTPTWLVTRTDDRVLVLDERGGVLGRYPIPEALRGREFTFGRTTAGEAVMYAHGPMDALATQVEYRICWVTPGGRCREAGVTLAQNAPMVSQRVWAGLVVPAPVVLGGIIAAWRPSELLQEGLAASYPEALGRALREFRPALVIAALAAAALAWLCYRRQVRYGAMGVQRVVWPLFVLALGLPGWVGYRFGRTWSVLESCPACGAAVPRDRDGCARCTAAFPAPALKGTELFA
jgi:hypothetical protein